MSEYPWNEKNNTFTWLSSLYNPFKTRKIFQNNYSMEHGFWLSADDLEHTETWSYILINGIYVCSMLCCF